MTEPVRQDLTCYKGQTYNQNFYFKHDKQPIDLTGCTARAQIRPAPNHETLTAEFTVSVSGEEGKVSLALSDTVTAAIIPGVYAWDLKMTEADGTVRYRIAGKFIVSGRVTE